MKRYIKSANEDYAEIKEYTNHVIQTLNEEYGNLFNLYLTASPAVGMLRTLLEYNEPELSGVSNDDIQNCVETLHESLTTAMRCLAELADYAGDINSAAFPEV